MDLAQIPLLRILQLDHVVLPMLSHICPAALKHVVILNPTHRTQAPSSLTSGFSPKQTKTARRGCLQGAIRDRDSIAERSRVTVGPRNRGFLS